MAATGTPAAEPEAGEGRRVTGRRARARTQGWNMSRT